MIRAGIAGIGFMGWIHWLAYQRVAGIRVAAISTRDERKLAGDWREIKGNFGPPGEQVELNDVRAYRRLDDLLSDDDVDLIDICLPPHLHAETAVRALEAGKHVFCEKPLALRAADCDRMVDAARAAGKLLLVGQVLPFLPEYAHALELVERGHYGKPLGGTFKRVISDPDWLPDFYNPDTIGGPLIDLHVHDAHLIRLLFGCPRAVVSRGRMRGDVVEYCQTLFDFEDPALVVGASSGVVRQAGRSFTHGFELHLEQATLQYELAVVGDQPEVLMPLTIYERNGGVVRPELGDGDMLRAFEAEIRAVGEAVSGGPVSPILAGEAARDAILLCHAQTAAVRSRQEVTIG